MATKKTANNAPDKAPESGGAAPAESASEYLVLTPIRYGAKAEGGERVSTRYLPGQRIWLTDDAAAALIACKAIGAASAPAETEAE